MPGDINQNDVKLMLAIIASAENIKTDNEKLCEIIGGGVSANGMRQRVQKIKNQAKAVLNGEDPGFGTKDKSPASTPKPKAPAKRGAAAATSGEDDEETPAKKRATTKAKGAAGAKKAKAKKAEQEVDVKAEEAEERADSAEPKTKSEDDGEI